MKKLIFITLMMLTVNACNSSGDDTTTFDIEPSTVKYDVIDTNPDQIFKYEDQALYEGGYMFSKTGHAEMCNAIGIENIPPEIDIISAGADSVEFNWDGETYQFGKKEIHKLDIWLYEGFINTRFCFVFLTTDIYKEKMYDNALLKCGMLNVHASYCQMYYARIADSNNIVKGISEIEAEKNIDLKLPDTDEILDSIYQSEMLSILY